MKTVIPVPATPSLVVQGTDERFPVRRIYCVGRNYADHAREMGMDPLREPPFFFGKPADVVVPGGGASEIAASIAVADAAAEVPTIEQYSMRAFADALETLPSALAENSGLDPIFQVSRARAAQRAHQNPRPRSWGESNPDAAPSAQTHTLPRAQSK